MKSTPSRWSVSCWIARASSSRALDRDRLAVHVEAVGDHRQRALAVDGQAGDRQAALGAVLVSSDRSSAGLTRWPTSPSTCQVKTRSPTPICGAARPAPGASSMVSVRSSTSRRSSLSKSTTSTARLAQDGVAEQADGLDGHGRAESRRRPGEGHERRRVDLDADRVELAGRAHAAAPRPARATARRPAPAAPGRRPATLAVVDLDRAEHLGAAAVGRAGSARRRRPRARR